MEEWSLLHDSSTYAKINSFYDERKIIIIINGKRKRDLFIKIKHEIDKIHFQYNKNETFEYDIHIPCKCSKCINEECGYYTYEDLMHFNDNDEEKIQCRKSFEMVKVKKLIDNYYPAKNNNQNINAKNMDDNKSQVEEIKIFLASSNELESDRNGFETFVHKKNNELIQTNRYIRLILWEDSLEAMSETRLQDEYNKEINKCDFFIMLFYSKLGKYTKEEFETALAKFKESKKPRIYTYFKDTYIRTANIGKEFNNVIEFKNKLIELGHFTSTYKDSSELTNKFNEQLTKYYNC